MFNNEVTYDEKWDTVENRAALDKLERKFFDYSACGPDCPVSWAEEVLELMETLDRELGFEYNTATIRGYYVQGNPLKWFILNPFKDLFYALKKYVFAYEVKKLNRRLKDFEVLSVGKRAKYFFESATHSIRYGIRALKIKYFNPIRNKLKRPKITLSQVKEKYGSLRVYYSCPPAFEEWVDQEIRKCELKLAKKGAYYPLESFWDAGISYNIENEYEPDSIKVENKEYDGKKYVSVTKTTYRKAMKELGFDLKEIEDKAEIRKAIKSNVQDP